MLTVLGLLPVALLGQLGVALAADGAKLGQTPAALSWIKLTDSRGLSVWNYELSLDRGGVTDPGKSIWSFVIDLFWQLYRGGVVIAIWFIDFALSFAWLPVIIVPVTRLSDSLTMMVARIGGTTTLLTIAAVVAVMYMMRGKWALGIFELFTSLLIASLATGALAGPVALVAGPSGMLMDSRQFGLEVADGLATGGADGAADADTLRQATTGRLVDTFLRLPLETINFGAVLDGGPCQGAYDDVLAAGPYGMEDDIRDAVAGCDAALGEVAENPGSGQALSAIILSPAAALVIGFATVLAGTVFLASLLALYQALKAIVTLVSGLLPGSARGALWMTIADLMMALVTLVFAIIFLSGYLLLIADVFTSRAADESAMQTFFFVDVLLVMALLLFWRGRKAIKRASGRLAQALATRPGAGPATALPQRQPFDAAGAYYKARMANNVVKGAAGVAGVLAGPAGAMGAAWATGRDRTYGGLRSGATGMATDIGWAGRWMRAATASSGDAGDGPEPSGRRTARPHGGRGPALPPGPQRGLPPGASGEPTPGPDEPKPSPRGGPRAPGSAPQRLTAALEDRQPASGTGRLVRAAGQLALTAATAGTGGAAVDAVGMAVARNAGGSALTGALSGRRRTATSSVRATAATSTGGGGTDRLAGPARSSSPANPSPRPAAQAGPAGAALAAQARPGRPTASVRQSPTPTRQAPTASPARTPGTGRVIDQDGRPVTDANDRLQARLAARRRPTGR